MRGAYAVAAMELKEKQRFFFVAALLAVIPFIIAIFPSPGFEKRVVIGVAASTLAVGMSFAVALAFGTSTARELVERRLSFYLTKPLSATEIWIGKFAAGLLASLICFFLIVTPGWLTSPAGWRADWAGLTLLGVVVGGILILYLVSHSVATITRSRSALLVLDILCTVAVILTVRGITRTLIAGEGLKELSFVVAGTGLVVLTALSVAPVWQIAMGRNDIRASHRELSRAFWLTLAAGLLVAVGYVAWLTPSSIEDLRIDRITQSPSGGDFIVNGTRVPGGDYSDSFLASQGDGEPLRLGTTAREIAWSEDGAVAAWIRHDGSVGFGRGSEIYIRERGGEPRASGITVPYFAIFTLSSDGSRIAVLADGKLSVHDLRQSALLASAATTALNFTALTFADPDLVRVYSQSTSDPTRPRVIQIHELSVPERSLTRTGEIAVPFLTYLSMSPDKSRILVRGTGVIADARTGEQLAAVSGVARAPSASALLEGNVLGVIDNDGPVPVLTLYSSTGARMKELQLPGVKAVSFAGQTSGGRLILAARNRRDPDNGQTGMFVIDRQTGEIEHFVPGLLGPVPYDPHPLMLPTFSDTTSFVAFDRDRRLFVWDPRTGESRPFGDG